MHAVRVNEELLADRPYFQSPSCQQELREMMRFDRRRVVFGEGALDTLGTECRRLGAGRVLLIRDPGVPDLEPLVRQALARERVEVVGVYEGILPNPTVASVDDCAAAVGRADCQAVVALGGGSVLDTAKAALCAATAGQSIAQFYGFDLFPEPARWPLLALPTTAGTGSEVSRASIVADETGKKAVFSDHLVAKVALVDPRLTWGMPPSLTATTGLDALGHALECTASKRSNPLGDAVARESVRSGCAYLERAIRDGGQDRQARLQMARCSLLAGLLLWPINTGAAHALGYGIEKVSAAKGRAVPHGAAVSLVLPEVMRHNQPAAADKYYYVAGVAGLELEGRTREEGVELAARWVDDLRRRHTPFGSLSSSGLGEADLPRMVEIAMTNRRLLDPNPVEVTAADAERIYRAVLN